MSRKRSRGAEPARPKVPEPPSGAERLVASAGGGNLDAVRALLDGGVDPNARIPGDPYGRLALIGAANHGHLEVVRLLLERGADAMGADPHGVTALYRAAERGGEAVVRALLAAGADPNASFGRGRPLHGATALGTVGSMVALIEAGGDVDARDCDGRTPLFLSETNHSPWKSEILLAAGADPRARDASGKTAAERARPSSPTHALRAALEAPPRSVPRAEAIPAARAVVERLEALGRLPSSLPGWTLLWRTRIESGRVTGLVFDVRGSRLAGAIVDEWSPGVCIWDAGDGRLAARLSAREVGPGNGIHACLEDGGAVVVHVYSRCMGETETTQSAWSVEGPQPRRLPDEALRGHRCERGGALQVDVSAEARSGLDRLRIVCRLPGREQLLATPHHVRAAAQSTGGPPRLAMAALDGTVGVYVPAARPGNDRAG